MLAEVVHTGQPSPALEAFSITRFGGEYDADAALREACVRQYTGWYSSAPPLPGSR